MGRSSQRTKGFGVNILRGSRSPLLAYLEKLLNMKTNIIIEKKFDALKMMREIRDKIDKETKGMSFTQLKEYYKKSAQLNKRKARSIPS